MAVWYAPLLEYDEELGLSDPICEQGYADLRLGGINERIARCVRSRYGSDFVRPKPKKRSRQ